MSWGEVPQWLALVGAAVVSTVLIILLRPLLQRYALARPNARSSHYTPTPQGGGVAVIAATALILLMTEVLFPHTFAHPVRLAIVFTCVIALVIIGATDDIRPLEAIPRLLLQAATVFAVIATLPAELRIVPSLPWWFERALMGISMLWFVNLVNFMDGIDWMTVAEVVPLTAALGLFGLAGALPADATITAFALCGAMIGFVPFNKPVARLFLGDVGSLPIGLLLAWLLVLLAGNGHLAAVLLLPLYYVADTTFTLLRRIVNREQILQAHRSHFYQRAMDGGYTVLQIVGRVFAVNVVLIALAAITLFRSSPIFHAAALAAGCVLVASLLWHFNRKFR